MQQIGRLLRDEERVEPLARRHRRRRRSDRADRRAEGSSSTTAFVASACAPVAVFRHEHVAEIARTTSRSRPRAQTAPDRLRPLLVRLRATRQGRRPRAARSSSPSAATASLKIDRLARRRRKPNRFARNAPQRHGDLPPRGTARSSPRSPTMPRINTSKRSSPAYSVSAAMASASSASLQRRPRQHRVLRLFDQLLRRALVEHLELRHDLRFQRKPLQQALAERVNGLNAQTARRLPAPRQTSAAPAPSLARRHLAGHLGQAAVANASSGNNVHAPSRLNSRVDISAAAARVNVRHIKPVRRAARRAASARCDRRAHASCPTPRSPPPKPNGRDRSRAAVVGSRRQSFVVPRRPFLDARQVVVVADDTAPATRAASTDTACPASRTRPTNFCKPRRAPARPRRRASHRRTSTPLDSPAHRAALQRDIDQAHRPCAP